MSNASVFAFITTFLIEQYTIADKAFLIEQYIIADQATLKKQTLYGLKPGKNSHRHSTT